MVKNRGRLEILNYIITFCTKDSWNKSLSTLDLEHTFTSNRMPPVGALVKLTSAPPTKWYLGWYVAYIPATKDHWEQHLIESIDDGTLCRWHNVGLSQLPIETVNKYPSWRWTDQQFTFNDKVIKAHRHSENNYVFRIWPNFGENKVEIPLRKRHLGAPYKEEEVVHTITLTDKEWKKISIKALTELLNIEIKKELKRK